MMEAKAGPLSSPEIILSGYYFRSDHFNVCTGRVPSLTADGGVDDTARAKNSAEKT